MTLKLPDGFLRHVALPVHGHKGLEQQRIIDALTPVYESTLIEYGIDNDQRAACFTGQAIVESDQFCTTQEYASGGMYEWREDLGNNRPGDGVLFKGRGIFQLTGRTNYGSMGQKMSLDLVNHPELAADPIISLKIACIYWNDRKISPLADAEDVEAVTEKINGGLNGLKERQDATDRAFLALGYN